MLPERASAEGSYIVDTSRSSLTPILQVRAEGQQTAITVLHDKLSRVPRHVAKSSRKFDAFRGVLGIKRVSIFDMKVCVKQFVGIFIRTGGGRRCAAKVNSMLVAGHDGVNRWILPHSQTLEAKFVFLIGDRGGNLGGEELRRDLTDHGSSVT